MVVDLTPASSYSGAPFVFGDDGSNFTYGQIHQLFSVAGTNPGTSSSTVVTQGQATPVSPFGASEISSSARKTSLADDAAVPYNGTNYVTYSTKNGKSEAIDGNNNLWILNGSAASATSGFPTFSLSKISPTYGIAPTTGALTATATSTVFTSASMNTYATGLLSFLKIDGGNNVWLGASSSTYGSWIEFTNSGAELSATSLGLGYVGSTGTGQTSIRGSAGHRANAIDASGNVWSSATNSNGDNLYVLIGQAVPTVAPLSQAVYNSQHNPTSTYGRVGTRP
jgi:hypothetical protein